MGFIPRVNKFTLLFEDGHETQFTTSLASSTVGQVRIALYLAAILYTTFGYLDYLIVREFFKSLWTVRSIVVSFILLIASFTYSRAYPNIMQPMMSALVFVCGMGIVAMIAISNKEGGNLYYAGLILVLMYSYTFVRLRFVYATLVSWSIGAAYFITATCLIVTPGIVLVSNSFFLAASEIIGMFACYTLESYTRRNYVQSIVIEIERRKSDFLLLNILPPEIADRLKHTPGTIADKHDQVTVLFCDISGFTPYSSRVSPEELVMMLDEIFSAFDGLCAVYRAEKIKTIGDAYMAAGGLIFRDPDHIASIANMALDMQTAMELLNSKWRSEFILRIGIDSGPVVAGVIGEKKFAYDLWGDTVNTASRMESHSIPGRIQVTERVGLALESRFIVESRGMISVKGKGEMRTFFLIGRM